MKRDMDLIRKMLLAVEDSPGGYAPRDLVINGYSEPQIAYHAYLICDAGLADGVDVTTMSSEGPEWAITHLTWAGHEFIEAARPQTRWDEAKSIINQIGGAALAVWQKVLITQAEQAVTNLIT